MAATNIFYRIPSQRGTRIASIAGTVCTLEQFCEYIIEAEGLDRHDFIFAIGTKVFRPSSCSLQAINLQNNSNVDILIPLLGGKGGFGSLLRAIGAQIEKTTNRDACRDLSGRRLRDIKREEELKKLVELRERLIEERKLRKKEKLEKLKRKSEKSKESSSIQELVAMFDDDAFNQRRLQLSEILDAAVEKGLINSKKRKLEEKASETCAVDEKRSRLEAVSTVTKTNIDKANVDLNKPHAGVKHALKKTFVKKNDLWLGLDEDVDDDDDDDESEVHAVN